MPSPKVSDIVVEPYNTVLSLSQLTLNSSATMLLDNEALYNICSKKFKIGSPTYGDLNHIVSQAMSGVTCSTRFPGQLNSSISKMLTSLVPFPTLHFFMVSQAPLRSRKNKSF